MGGDGDPGGEDGLVHGGDGGVAARRVGARRGGRRRRGRRALARGQPRLPALRRAAGPLPALRLPELAPGHTARLRPPISRHRLCIPFVRYLWSFSRPVPWNHNVLLPGFSADLADEGLRLQSGAGHRA